MSIGNLTPNKLHNNQKTNTQRLWKNYGLVFNERSARNVSRREKLKPKINAKSQYSRLTGRAGIRLHINRFRSTCGFIVGAAHPTKP